MSGGALRRRAASTTTPSSRASRAAPPRRIESEDDVRDVIALIRLNYDRAVARHGLPGESSRRLRGPPRPRRPRALPFAPIARHPRLPARSATRGNLLIYSTDGVGDEADAIEDLGGVSRHYLNHGHEAMFRLRRGRRAAVRARGRARVGRAELPRPRHLLEAPHARRRLRGDPDPGHTPGATAYLWDSGEHRFLFTGDTIYLRRGRVGRRGARRPATARPTSRASS